MRGRSLPWRALLAAGLAAIVVAVLALAAPAVFRSAGPTIASTPEATRVSTAPPAVAVPGGSGPRVTVCAEIVEPTYLPRWSAHQYGSSRSESSQDIVTFEVDDLVVEGEPTQLTIISLAAGRSYPGPTRQIGPREVTFVSTNVPIATFSPGGEPPPSFAVRSELRAVWSEPDAACPYFAAILRSASSDADAIERELVRIVSSMAPAPPFAPPTSGVDLPEADAWTKIRELFPGGPVAMPTWLPAEVDRERVELRALTVTPRREYEVVYHDATGVPLITFRLGPIEEMRESGIGLCCVRGSQLAYEFEARLFNDRGGQGLRRMRWTEQTRTLSFWSEHVVGEDMFRIAWALDRETAPPNHYHEVRDKTGACASAQGPEATVRALLTLAGSNDRPAVLDCYALDAVLAQGTSVADWAELPRTGYVQIQATEEFAGRRWVTATWSFASNPGGAWGMAPTMFFLLGLEDGVWRIFDSGTGPGGAVP